MTDLELAADLVHEVVIHLDEDGVAIADMLFTLALEYADRDVVVGKALLADRVGVTKADVVAVMREKHQWLADAQADLEEAKAESAKALKAAGVVRG